VPSYCAFLLVHFLMQLASLTLAAPDVAVRQLFHFREDGDLNNPTFSNVSLLLYFLMCVALAMIMELILCACTDTGYYLYIRTGWRVRRVYLCRH
jgi:hypothetical protein